MPTMMVPSWDRCKYQSIIKTLDTSTHTHTVKFLSGAGGESWGMWHLQDLVELKFMIKPGKMSFHE